jgi:hypothetical protein
VSGPQDRPRWRVQVVRCGGCGKSRGLRHTCTRRLGRRPQRTRVKPQIRVRCKCGQLKSPFAPGHVCRVGTDFKKRKRSQSAARRRAREQAARRRRRDREAAARRARRDRETAARRRRRDAERDAARIRRQRERERRQRAAEARRTTPRRERTRKPATSPARRAPNPNEHRYDMCRDDECQRRACVAYRQGVEDCPLSHH